MLWIWQLIKLVKLFASFIKAIANILDSKEDTTLDVDEAEPAQEEVAEPVIEKPIPAQRAPKAEIVETGPSTEIAKSKDDSFVSGLAGVVGFTVGALAVIYLINRYIVPTYSKAPKALPGDIGHFKVDEGILAYYKEGEGIPLVLLHGINPGASSHEMEVLFNRFRFNHTVYSLDLLGFGLSQRPDIDYTPDIYIRHLTEFLSNIKTLHNHKPDVIALGLTTEFVVAAAEKDPELMNKLILISPTGLENSINRTKYTCTKLAVHLFRLPIVGQGLFNAITSKTVLKNYLSRRIFVEPRNLSYLMLQQYYYTTHVEGAKNAPSYYVAGELIVEELFQKYLKLQVPTHIVYGTGAENVCKFDAVKSVVRENPCVSEKVIENGGLLTHIEKPDQFFNIADKFFQNN